MEVKKAAIIKVSDLPGVTKYKSLKDAIKAISKNLATLHAKTVAKAAVKGGR